MSACPNSTMIPTPKRELCGPTYTSEPHSPRDTPNIHPLPRLKPIRTHPLPNTQPQPTPILDLKLRQMPLRANPRLRIMPQHRPRDVLRLLLPRPNLHSPVSMLLPRLERHNLVAIHLQHRARRALPRLRVVEGRHAALQGKETRAQRRRVRFSFQRRRRCGVQRGHVVAVCEAVSFGAECGFDAARACVGECGRGGIVLGEQEVRARC